MLVTERDEVVAELRPSRRQTPIADRIEELLESLAAAGKISRAAHQKAIGRGAAAAWDCRQEPRRR